MKKVLPVLPAILFSAFAVIASNGWADDGHGKMSMEEGSGSSAVHENAPKQEGSGHDYAKDKDHKKGHYNYKGHGSKEGYDKDHHGKYKGHGEGYDKDHHGKKYKREGS